MESQSTPQTQIPSVTPTSPTPQTLISRPVPQVKSSLVFIMSILLLVTVAIASLFYFQIQKLSKELAKYQPQPSPAPTATLDPTANWPIYTSVNYSFKYPADWKVTEQTNAAGQKTGGLMVTAPIPATSKKTAYSINLFITDTELPTALNYVQDLIAQHPKGKPGELIFENQAQISVGSQEGIKLSDVFMADHSANLIFVLFNRKIYQIGFPTEEDNSNIENPSVNYVIANQILSTFKFIEASPSASPASN